MQSGSSAALPLVLLGTRPALKAGLGLAPAEMVYESSLRPMAELVAPLTPRYSGPLAVLRRAEKTVIIEENGAQVTVASDRTKPTS
ncbi:hypothetical protein M514_00006 [Trichuris suis]|uniref:Uncharacterized protein n=1 Tax=Trichuris suis TaxID=68888 RepID=A0A085NTQ8_9BILA|nr:hypothetical protein M513_00006 [Trichuris suis]KFD72854.1 hypothetical protein M514_00006 [Trichuris suis]